MKIFISWSGEISHKIALVFHDWIPTTIQTVDTWISSEDISKGVRWGEEIAKQLNNTQYGIICVVPDNVKEPWLNFEAGALSKSIELIELTKSPSSNIGFSRVSPFLLGLTPKELSGPLSQFQSTTYQKEDLRRLIQSINSVNTQYTLEKERLNKTFDLCWPEFKEKIDPILDLIQK